LEDNIFNVKSRLQRAWNVLAGTPKPKTRIASGSSKQTFFDERDRNTELLNKFEIIYTQGGIVSEAEDGGLKVKSGTSKK